MALDTAYFDADSQSRLGAGGLVELDHPSHRCDSGRTIVALSRRVATAGEAETPIEAWAESAIRGPSRLGRPLCRGLRLIF